MTWRDVVDRVIEGPVVTSYTRVGSAVRSRLDEWRTLDSYDLEGRTVVLTGATSGLGLAAARQLARCGATLVLVARNQAKAEGVARDLVDVGLRAPATPPVVIVADLGSLADVRAAAEQIDARCSRIDALVHNAGTLTPRRELTADGIELTVASQVVGPFLLTCLLRDLLVRSAASAPARVLTMSSGGMYTQPLDVSQLEMAAPGYRGSVAYARAKRAQVTLNEMWGERLAGTGVVFHALHPGWADTPGVREALPRFRVIVGPLLRSPAQGADTLVWLAADDGAPLASTGDFWLDRRRRSIHRLRSTCRSDTPEARRELWAWCESHSGCTA